MTVHIHHDKETYSEVDLTKIGAYKYAADPTTDCLLTSGVVRGEKKIRRWRPGLPFPYEEFDPAELVIHAWNSQFERLIWREIMVPRYGWPELDLEQFVCTAAHARLTAASPGKLDVACRFFDTRAKKDQKGHQHMLKMCRPATDAQQLKFIDKELSAANYGSMPRAKFEHWRDSVQEAAKRCHHTAANIDRLHDYCDDDVWTEKDIYDLLPAMRIEWKRRFWTFERINDHGIVVDTKFAEVATTYADDEAKFFAEELAEITGGIVNGTKQYQRQSKWILENSTEEVADVMRWYDDGKEKYSIDADTRQNLLAEDDIDPGFLSEDVREFVEILDASSKSSISKYQAITNSAIAGLTDENKRIHGQYVFAGAAQSGRASAGGIQVHNLLRDVPKKAAQMIQAFKRDDRKAIGRLVQSWADAKNAKAGPHSRKTPAEPIHALGALVRPTLTGCPESTFDIGWCDWSSIEARMLPWLSNDPRADDRLAIFRKGGDVYLKTASEITGKTITKEHEFERQAFGKVPELSLGYLGGVGAFMAMAKNYGVRLDEPKVAEIVKKWRGANPWAMDFGAALEEAAKAAILSKNGASFAAGRIDYQYDPDALDGIGALFAMLPSGRELCYPGARLELVKTKWGKEKLGITAMKGAWQPKKGVEAEWPRVSVWPGLLSENATQAACADLLMIALERCEQAGLVVPMHTHDEIMIESAAIERDVQRLLVVMTTRPGWRGDDALPLKAEAGYGYRYKVPFEDAEKMELAA